MDESGKDNLVGNALLLYDLFQMGGIVLTATSHQYQTEGLVLESGNSLQQHIEPFLGIETSVEHADDAIVGNLVPGPDIGGRKTFRHHNACVDNAQLGSIDGGMGTEKHRLRQFRIEDQTIQMTVEPTVEQSVLTLAGEMTAHHHTHLLPTRQTSGITGCKSVLEVMGVDGTRLFFVLTDHPRHLPGALHVEGTAQSQWHHLHPGLGIFLDDGLDRLAENGDVDTVLPLVLTQVVDILFTSAPFLIRHDMEYLHAAKILIFLDIVA